MIDFKYQKSIISRLEKGVAHMDGYKLGVVETRFAELIWQHEPLTSGELVKLCEQELQWKKITTYTVLKNCANTVSFQNENGTVTSLLSQEGYNAVQSEKFVEDTFDGSLPAFLGGFYHPEISFGEGHCGNSAHD